MGCVHHEVKNTMVELLQGIQWCYLAVEMIQELSDLLVCETLSCLVVFGDPFDDLAVLHPIFEHLRG